MKRKRVLVALFALLVACNSPVGLPLGVLGILQVEEAVDLIEVHEESREFVVLDVRTEAEFRAGHIEGAIWIDWLADDFEARIAELPREWLYLVYCAGGSRSAQACEEMARLGFERLYDLDGGFGAWHEAGCKWVCEEHRDGERGERVPERERERERDGEEAGERERDRGRE